MTDKLYSIQEDGSISFNPGRKSWGVDIPAHAYDLWMPLIGLRPIGVYGLIWRLARNNQTKGMGIKKLARAAGMGDAALVSDLMLLEKCGFIKILPGNNRQSNGYDVLDIPVVVSAELIQEIKPNGYQPLCPWLVDRVSPNEDAASSNKDAASPNEDTIIDPSFEPSIEPILIAPSGNEVVASPIPGKTETAVQRQWRLNKERQAALDAAKPTGPIPGNPTPAVEQHPLTMLFIKAAKWNKTLTKEMLNVLVNDFEVSSEFDPEAKKVIRGGLISAWNDIPGFENFATERIPQMLLAYSDKPINTLLHLRNFNKADGKMKGFYAWREANPSLCSVIAPGEPAGPQIVWTIPEEEVQS